MILKELPEPHKRGVGALALAAGIGVMDEALVEQRLDHVDQHVMNHPVAVGCGRDQPFFGILNDEVVIWAVMVGLVYKFFMKPKEILLQVHVENESALPVALSLLCLL